MSLKSLKIEPGLTNDELGRLIVELHQCVDNSTAATNLRIDGLERAMAQNARSAIEVFVPRVESDRRHRETRDKLEEVNEKLAAAAEDRRLIKEALGVKDPPPKDRSHPESPTPASPTTTALAWLSQMKPWHAAGMLGSFIIFVQIIVSALPGLKLAGLAVWHALIK
jgi:hypothetical protein